MSSLHGTSRSPKTQFKVGSKMELTQIDTLGSLSQIAISKKEPKMEIGREVTEGAEVEEIEEIEEIGVIGAEEAEIADNVGNGKKEIEATARAEEDRETQTNQKKCMWIRTLVHCQTTRWNASKSSSNKNKVNVLSFRTLHSPISRTSRRWLGKFQKQDQS